MVERAEFLRQRQKEGLFRILNPISYRQAGRVYLDKKEYLDFSSNDYLGLSGHPKIVAESKKGLDRFGTSACASRLLSGDLEIHHQLEDKVAQFKNKEAGLIFNSGYQANLGIIPALYQKGDCIFSDRLNHASIIDGMILSGARFFRFPHNDVENLESLLEKERNKFQKALIVIETIFSMDGDRPPLRDIVSLKEKYNCEILVDEAHATGIFGKRGSGVAEEEGLEEKIDFMMGTFSKALGGFGAYLATTKKIKEYLINTCRSFIYSTALPPALIAGNLAGIELVEEEPYRRTQLLAQAQYFRDKLKELGLEVRGASQIVPVVIGDNLKTVEFARRLQEKGYWIHPIRPPTVKQGQARLRFSLTFYHHKEILEQLINDIKEIRI